MQVSGVTRHRATGGSVQEKHRRFHQFEQELEGASNFHPLSFSLSCSRPLVMLCGVWRGFIVSRAHRLGDIVCAAMRPLEAEDDGEGPCYSGDEGEDFVPASPSPPRKRVCVCVCCLFAVRDAPSLTFLISLACSLPVVQYLHDEDSSP